MNKQVVAVFSPELLEELETAFGYYILYGGEGDFDNMTGLQARKIAAWWIDKLKNKMSGIQK